MVLLERRHHVAVPALVLELLEEAVIARHRVGVDLVEHRHPGVSPVEEDLLELADEDVVVRRAQRGEDLVAVLLIDVNIAWVISCSSSSTPFPTPMR